MTASFGQSLREAREALEGVTFSGDGESTVRAVAAITTAERLHDDLKPELRASAEAENELKRAYVIIAGEEKSV